MILDTTTMAHDKNLDKCRQHGSILPEPRNQEKNEFLSGLDIYEVFLLGMEYREIEGTWVSDSDSTPLIYQNWKLNNLNESSYNTNDNCAFIYRKVDWGDIPCLSWRRS